MQAVLPRLSSTTDPVLLRKPYSRPSSSSCHNAATASDGIRRVGTKSALLRFRLRRNLRPLPCASFPRLKRFAGLIRGPRSGDWREKVPAYSRPSSSSCHSAATASDGIRRVGAKSALLRFRLRRNLRPLPCASFPRLKRFADLIRGPRFGDWREKVPAYSRPSSSSCHNAATASDGIRQSPRGDRATEPTLGPSARQLRLNCWEKKRR